MAATHRSSNCSAGRTPPRPVARLFSVDRCPSPAGLSVDGIAQGATRLRGGRSNAALLCAAVFAVGPVGLASGDPACGLYQYRAQTVRVIDGDTIVADVDLGFHTWRRDERLRLAGIDAPEPSGETRDAGVRATQALRERIEGRELVICTLKDEREKYGRYLVLIYDGDQQVNDWMVAQGFAVPSY